MPDPVKLDGQDGRDLLSGIDANTITSGLLRLTYQANASNKFSGYMDRIFKDRFRPHGAGDDPATAPNHQGSPIYYTGAAKWTSTISSRLLLEAGYSSNVENWSYEERQDSPPLGPARQLRQPRPSGGVAFCPSTPCYHVGNPAAIALQSGAGMDPWYQIVRRNDSNNNFRDRGNWSYVHETPERFNYNVSLSYVTGSHNIKAGIMSSWGPHHRSHGVNADIWQADYRDGVPYRTRVSNLPIWRPMDYRDNGYYAQDTWTIDRLTLNLGLRFETMHGRNLSTEPHSRTGSFPASSRAGAEQPAELEGHRAAAGDGLRPVRRRVDGDQVLVRPLQRLEHHQLQPAVQRGDARGARTATGSTAR